MNVISSLIELDEMLIVPVVLAACLRTRRNRAVFARYISYAWSS